MSDDFDYSDIINSVKEDMAAEDKKKKKAENKLDVEIGLGSDLGSHSDNPEDYVAMPPWWKKSFGVVGLPFGKIVQVAGDSDTGKTSLCIEAMRAAQAQGVFIVYVETEKKTQKEDLAAWDVDPSRVAVAKTNITEKVFEVGFRLLNKFFEKNPNGKALLLIDSFGNTISKHDQKLNLNTDSAKVGGAAKTNRVGLGKLVAMMENYKIAPMIVNYHYANMGSHGTTQAGGKALKFYTTLGITTSRTKFTTVIRSGQEFTTGIEAKWGTFKNHFAKGLTDEEGNTINLPKNVALSITYEGIKEI